MYRIILIAHFCIFFLSCRESSSIKSNEANKEEQRLESSLDSINFVIRDDINNAQHYFNRAKIHLKLGRKEAYLKDIERTIKMNSEQAEPYLSRALYYKDNKQFDNYRQNIVTCVSKKDTFEPCLLEKAWIHLVLKEYSKLFIVVNTVLKNNPYSPRAYYYKGLAYVESNNKPLAISSLQTAVEVDNNFIEAYLLLANIYNAEDSVLALDYYNNAIRIDSNNLEALYGKALYLQNHKHYEQAIKIYNHINSLGEYREPNFNIGFIHYSYLKEPEKAITFFNKSLVIDTSYIEAYIFIGKCYDKLGNNTKATTYFKRALSIDPTHTEAAVLYGKAKERQ